VEWIAARAQQGDILALRNERNGCSSGRNLGVRATRGEIVVFLDSDQRALPALLARSCARHPAPTTCARSGQPGTPAWFRDREPAAGTIVDDLPERG